MLPVTHISSVCLCLTRKLKPAFLAKTEELRKVKVGEYASTTISNLPLRFRDSCNFSFLGSWLWSLSHSHSPIGCPLSNIIQLISSYKWSGWLGFFCHLNVTPSPCTLGPINFWNQRVFKYGTSMVLGFIRCITSQNKLCLLRERCM